MTNLLEREGEKRKEREERLILKKREKVAEENVVDFETKELTNTKQVKRGRKV